MQAEILEDQHASLKARASDLYHVVQPDGYR